MLCEIWQYSSADDELPVEEFYMDLQTIERAKVDSRMKMLRNNGPKLFAQDWFPHLGKGIYKFKSARRKGARMVRILACVGPVDVEHEVTLLVPCFEVGDRLPAGVEDQAVELLAEVAGDPTGRRKPWKQ